MAHMYPPAPMNPKKVGETSIYRLLATLPADYTIYQGIEIHTELRAQHELDFTIIHPRQGIIVLEVKSGRGRQIDANGVAQYKRHGAAPKDPYTQAMAARATLWQKFLEDPTLAPCFERTGLTLDAGMAYGVCFSAKKRAAFTFATLDRAALAITQDELGGIDAFLQRLTPPHADPIFTEREWEALNEALWRLSGRHQTLAQRFSEERVIFHHLISSATAEVDAQMVAQSHAQRLAVEGRAGTGKTVLAYRTAQALAARGQNVLLLCARIGEKDMITRDMHFDYTPFTHDLSFTVAYLEEWFHTLLGRAGIPSPTTLDLLAVRGQLAAAALLSEALARLAAAGQAVRYDAIMVDEAQDFTAPLWPIILGCLATTQGYCAAFYDNEQSFFAQPFAPSWLGPAVAPLRLEHNLRNTRAIYQQMCQLNPALEPLPPAALNPPGVPIVIESPSPANTHSAAAAERIKRIPDDPTRRTKVEEAQLVHYLRYLIHREKIRPENILIISCRRQRTGGGKGKTKASAFFRKNHLGDIALCPLRERGQDALPTEQRSVRITTLHGVKGLDSDVVILVELDGMIGQPQKARLGYIAVSRARHALYIFGKHKELNRYFTVADRDMLPPPPAATET